MIKIFLAAVAAALLVTACMPSINDDAGAKVSVSPAPASSGIIRTRLPNAGADGIPADINIPASVGEVVFHHQMHMKDLSIKCVECHHQINAKELNTPHPDYLKSSWINCKVCHDGAAKIKQNVYACSGCHHSNPVDISDETLSSKVVIHKQCWKCHPVNTGKEASNSCEKCHTGKKTL